MLPNFLMIGAARSGTTTLHSSLRTRTDVYLPPKRPEPHFFFKDEEFAKGLLYYESRFFSDWSGQPAVGECSTSYFYGAAVPGRIAAALPDVKLICLLRNPIDRAFSGYWHSVLSGLENLPFDEAVLTERAREAAIAGTPLGALAPFAYIDRGRYTRQLQRWFEYFDRDRFQIVLFEDLCAAPAEALRSVDTFLGLEPPVDRHAAIAKENASVPAGARMTKQDFQFLADALRDDVLALQDLLDRDLRHWLEQPNPGVVSLD